MKKLKSKKNRDQRDGFDRLYEEGMNGNIKSLIRFLAGDGKDRGYSMSDEEINDICESVEKETK